MRVRNGNSVCSRCQAADACRRQWTKSHHHALPVGELCQKPTRTPRRIAVEQPAARFVNRCLTRTGIAQKILSSQILRPTHSMIVAWNPLLLRRSHAGVSRLGGPILDRLQRTLPHHAARSRSSFAPRATRLRRALRRSHTRGGHPTKACVMIGRAFPSGFT